MYSCVPVEKLIIDLEKIFLKSGIVFFAGMFLAMIGMPLSAYEPGNILKGYIQEKTMYEKSGNDALFLLQKKWIKELKRKYGNNKITEIERGIIYVPMYMKIGNRRVKVNITEINRQINPDLEIIPQMASVKIHSKAKIKNIAEKNFAITAVNGSYFKPDTGTPLGALVINNEIITGPIYERAAFGIGDKVFKTGEIKFKGELKAKYINIKIDNINQPRTSEKQVLIYTDKWGNKAPDTSKHSEYIYINENKVKLKANYPLIIEKGGVVISAPINTFKNIEIGDEVELKYGLLPDWKNINHIISAGPYLVKNGSIFVDTEKEKLTNIAGRNPRTAIGYTLDNVMIMVTVDGRKEGYTGVTLKELACIMKKLGCCNAINLDGGSSTVMYVKGKIYTGSNIKGAVAINNALIVRNRVS